MSEPDTTVVLGSRYRLRERLAWGGMGTVWEGVDETLNRPVAVKLLNEGLADDERFIERFRGEAKAAAGLLHPNVAGVFDYGEDRGRPFIVMELIEGETLAQLAAKKGPLPPDEVARIGADVAQALSLAHEAGIVHRDVKPANIMLTRRGEVKVMDFGIAAEVLAGRTGLTGTGLVLGTAKYLSPEQAQGQPATPASDVYSLGTVLYELLAGSAPFEHPSPMATAMAHVNDPPQPLVELRPDAPPRLAATVERCLAKDPADRPRSAAALAAELRGDQPVSPDADTAVLPAADATDALQDQPAASAAAITQAIPRRAPTRAPGPSAWARMNRAGRRFVLILAAAVIVAVLLALVVTAGGGGTVKVPTFVGKPGARAERLAADRGLGVKLLARTSDQPKGFVIKQIPHTGAEVPSGSEVILIVSSGAAGANPLGSPPPSGGHGKGKGKGHGKGKHDGEGD